MPEEKICKDCRKPFTPKKNESKIQCRRCKDREDWIGLQRYIWENQAILKAMGDVP